MNLLYLVRFVNRIINYTLLVSCTIDNTTPTILLVSGGQTTYLLNLITKGVSKYQRYKSPYFI